jgi:hypothetical protein
MKRLLLAFLKNEDGIFPAILTGIGSALTGASIGKAIVGLGTTYLGSRIGASLDRRNATLDYERQRALGFTHSEIAGAGGASAGDTAQAVMGNQATQFEAQRRQMEYDNAQREADRAVAMRGQDAQVQTAQIGANASIYGANTQREIATMHNDRQWQQLANEWANNNPEINLRFKELTMGFENQRLALILLRNGLSLANAQSMSQGEFNRRMTSVMSELAAMEGLGGMKNEGIREGVATINDGLNPNPNPLLGNGQNYGTPGMPKIP